MVEPFENLLRRKDIGTRRRELDRQRQTVDAAADGGHGTGVGVGQLEA
jgi:hypothetical protein